MADNEKKLIIDEDWKKQAKQEKQKVTDQVQDQQKKAQPEQQGRQPLPPATFNSLVSMLVTQAFFSLGLLEIEGQKKQVDLNMAKYNIDLLEVLSEKTKGNLTDEEAAGLKETLTQLQMAFVKIAQQD